MITPVVGYLTPGNRIADDVSARALESAQRDIVNLQRRDDDQTWGGPRSGGDGGDVAEPAFVRGSLSSTLVRGGTATLDLGASTEVDIADPDNQLPGTITLPTGTKLYAHRHAASGVYYVDPPAWSFTLPDCTLPGGGINAAASGTVTTPFGNVTAHNRSATKAVGSGWCAVAWDEDADVWILVNFDPDCDP